MVKRCLVGLIGANIQRSLSPALHEDAFAAAGVHGFYHLMDLDLLGARADLATLLAAVRAAGFAGVNVTHPCKETVIPLLDALADEARAIGAVNTVVIDADGRTRGHNTDATGFANAFVETLGRPAAESKRIAVIGAGGAGRAVTHALLGLGVAELNLFDTNGARAKALTVLDVSRVRSIDSVEAALAGADGVVNATPRGMHGYGGSAVPEGLLVPGLWVADVVYTPLETPLIATARERGCRVLTGGGMCVHQAAEAFFLFTGLRPDLARMRRLFERLAA